MGPKILNRLEGYFSKKPSKTRKTNNYLIRGLGVYTHNSNVYLYYSPDDQITQYHVAISADGFVFERFQKNLTVATPKNITLKYSTYHNFKAARVSEGEDFTLLFQSKIDGATDLFTATSKDLVKWRFDSHIPHINEPASLVQDYRFEDSLVMYYGEENINIAMSKNGHDWRTEEQPVLTPRRNYFDDGKLIIENAFLTDKGILVVYHSQKKHGRFTKYVVGAALFDPYNPKRLLWRSSQPIWDSTEAWRGKNIRPVGTVLFREKIMSYWDVEGEGIFAVVYSFYKLHFPSRTKNVSLQLKRAEANPMIAPKSENGWENFNTFNGAAIYEGEKVHILYRAQGFDYISHVGYAASTDGITISERLDEPVFTNMDAVPKEHSRMFANNSPFSSGGGYGGCEDPRLTKIDGRIYMTYVANDGSLPRLALTSISVEDFLNKRWLWEEPVLISPPGVIDKSGCLLPEKVNGKYVVFHRIFPNILIDFVDDLAFDGTKWLKGEYSIKIRPDKWDSRKIGAGAPPLRTKDGWLLIYYAVDDKDPGKYKVGAMLLDLKDPTKVLHRTNAPILEPDTPLENEGFKPGIAYPCGAVVIKDTLFVYYGGADSVVCVATANLDQFLSELKYSEIAKLSPAIIRKVL